MNICGHKERDHTISKQELFRCLSPCTGGRASTRAGVESDAGGAVEDFCPEDWVDGADVDVPFTKIIDADAEHHGHGATALAELGTVDEDVVELTLTLRQLRDADSSFKTAVGVLGVSLRNTLASVVYAEEKKLAAHMKGTPESCCGS